MDHPPPELITERAALEVACLKCRKADRVAVDTESDSFYHYREKICLVQLAVVEGGVRHDYLVDPLAPGFDPTPLSELLADQRVSKVFHDVGYDLLLFKRHWGVVPRPVFDTMLGMRMLGAKQFGLGAVLKERFGVDIDKALQRSDWSLRPLTKDQLAYAANDTRYLLPLAENVQKELADRNRLAWFTEECDRLLTKEAPEPKNEDERFWALKGVKKLKGPPLDVARALYRLRERYAAHWDRPTFRVFANETLFALAEARPSHLGELSKIKGVGSKLVHAAGREILELCRTPPPFSAPARVVRTTQEISALQAVEDRFEKLRQRRKEVAAELGLDPEVILSNATLWDLAKDPTPNPQAHPDFQGWREPVLAAKFAAPLPPGPGAA